MWVRAGLLLILLLLSSFFSSCRAFLFGNYWLGPLYVGQKGAGKEKGPLSTQNKQQARRTRRRKNQQAQKQTEGTELLPLPQYLHRINRKKEGSWQRSNSQALPLCSPFPPPPPFFLFFLFFPFLFLSPSSFLSGAGVNRPGWP